MKETKPLFIYLFYQFVIIFLLRQNASLFFLLHFWSLKICYMSSFCNHTHQYVYMFDLSEFISYSVMWIICKRKNERKKERKKEKEKERKNLPPALIRLSECHFLAEIKVLFLNRRNYNLTTLWIIIRGFSRIMMHLMIQSYTIIKF